MSEPSTGPAAQRLRVMPEIYTVTFTPDISDAPIDDGSWRALIRAPEGLTVIRAAAGGSGDGGEPGHDGEPGGGSSHGDRPGHGDDTWHGLYGDVSHGLDVPGMLAAILVPLAAAGIPVFVASTYHTDLVLVPAARLGVAIDALRSRGIEVATPAA